MLKLNSELIIVLFVCVAKENEMLRVDLNENIYRRISMPKAQNIEEKYINGIKVDKEDEMCAFNDEQHLYFNKQTGETYTSVTQLISKYCQEFNEEF
jgi:hypothetical protein